jgi:tetratricopeptide (TPR) repeat protein
MSLRSGRQGPALDAYRAALRADPEAAGAWNGIGAVLMETRRYEEARNAFVRAVEADPDNAEARYNLSFVLSNLGDFEGALRETKRALELNPYYTTPRFKLAIDLQYEYAEVLAPELDAAERLVGDDKVEAFTFDDAALDQIFKELAPQSAAAAPAPVPADSFALAEDFISKGLLDRALAEIRRVAVAGADAVDAALLTGQVFLRQGLDGEALERFDAALARVEGRPWSDVATRAWGGRARALLRLERWDEARAAAETVAQHAPERADNLQVLGEALLHSGAPADAVRVFGRAVELQPGDAGLLRHLGRAALAAGRNADAERALRMAVKADPDFVAARVELARLLLESGRVDDAVRETRAALDVLPTYSEASLLLGHALRAAGRPREAVGALVDLLAGDPYHFDALVLLGQALADDGRPADARQAFTRVLKFDPDRPEALFQLGVLAAAERRFREAIGLWRRVVEAAPAGPLAAAARENIDTALDVVHVFQNA